MPEAAVLMCTLSAVHAVECGTLELTLTLAKRFHQQGRVPKQDTVSTGSRGSSSSELSHSCPVVTTVAVLQLQLTAELAVRSMHSGTR